MPSVIGGVLLVAAGLKLESLQFQRTIHSHLSAADAPTVIAIVSEVFIAVWLFSGHAPTWARRATMLLLTVFLCTAAWRWHAGDADCGCFGAVAIHPAWTMALDAVLLLTLLGSHWKLPAPTMAFEASTARGIVGAICVFALTFLAAREYRARATVEQRVVVLDSGSWRGERFPLLDFIVRPPPADLTTGRCTVILFDRNCQDCIAHLARFGKSSRALNARRKIWAIDIAPDPGEISNTQLHLRLPRAFLRPGIIYAADVPMTVSLNNGRVEAVSQP
ncbi:MAG TPA: MauE/DoxX family redox-associated membrane protein [Acidobacteriaceae bacterium]|nr:MauE/DoxX family redox-associated membrane protein [Acidobacteriaceae bacterium]